MDIVDSDKAVKVSLDSTFLKVYSRRGRKGDKGDRGARVGKTGHRNYELGWRAHTVTSMSARATSDQKQRKISGEREHGNALHI